LIDPGALEWCPHYLCALCDGQLIFEADALEPLQQAAVRVCSRIAELEAARPEHLGLMFEQIPDDALAEALTDGEHPLLALLRLDQSVVVVGPLETDGILGDTSHCYFAPSGHHHWVETQKPRLDALEATLARLLESGE
jgi:hypothetical protein